MNHFIILKIHHPRNFRVIYANIQVANLAEMWQVTPDGAKFEVSKDGFLSFRHCEMEMAPCLLVTKSSPPSGVLRKGEL